MTDEDWQQRMADLLKVIGTEGTCRGCGKTIWWLSTKRGRPAPYDADGVSHFATCPRAAMFRKERP